MGVWRLGMRPLACRLPVLPFPVTPHQARSPLDEGAAVGTEVTLCMRCGRDLTVTLDLRLSLGSNPASVALWL